MTDLEIAKTLRDAAQYIRDHGWIQGTSYAASGKTCVLGAIAGALGCFWTHKGATVPDITRKVAAPATDALAAALEAWPPIWNDAPGRTAAEVLDLFESVALQHELRALAGTIGERVGEPATAGEVTNPESHPGGGVDRRAPGSLALQVPANA